MKAKDLTQYKGRYIKLFLKASKLVFNGTVLEVTDSYVKLKDKNNDVVCLDVNEIALCVQSGRNEK